MKKRLIKVTPSGYFKTRLFSIDDHFARDINELFFAQFVTEIHLANSNMTIQLRKGKALTRDGRKITSGMLQNKQEVEKLIRNKDAVRFMQPLRGTPAYYVHSFLHFLQLKCVVHLNTEGLPSHVNDIKSHYEMYLSDILCLTEPTRLLCC